MTSPDDPLAPLRAARQARIEALEDQVRAAAQAALAEWLPSARAAALPTVRPTLTAVTAAALPPTPDAILPTKTAWFEAVDEHIRAALVQAYNAGVVDAGDVELLQVEQARQEYLAGLDNRLSGIPNDAWEQVMSTVAQLASEGASIPRIRDAIAAILAVGNWSNNAETIARTETVGAYNAGTWSAWSVEAAATGEKTDKVWVATHDTRTREDHVDADGQRVGLDGVFMVGGFPLRFPGDPLGPAGQVINCRCSMIQVELGEPLPQVSSHPWPDRDASQPLEVVVAAGAPPEQGEQQMGRKKWRSQMAPLGQLSGDGRVLAADGEWEFRDLPRPVSFQRADEPGHDGAVTIGRILKAQIKDGFLYGEGDFLPDVPETAEALMLLENKVLYPSVDLDNFEFTWADPATLKPLEDMSEEQLDALWEAGVEPVMLVTKGRVGKVTLLSFEAFPQTTFEVVDDGSDDDQGDGGGDPADADYRVSVVAAGQPTGRPARFTKAPLYPPRGWFEQRQYSELQPHVVTAEGQIFGHTNDRDCHMSFLSQGVCLLPPEEGGLDWYHGPEIELDDGGLLAVGRITAGTTHAGLDMDAFAARYHYDNTGAQVAVVRAYRDQFGTQVAGAIVPEATPEQVQLLRRSTVSGDWRDVGGARQMVAILCTNNGGFPVVRGRVSHGRVVSMIASAWPGWRPSGGRAVPGGGSVDIAVRRALAAHDEQARVRRAAERVAASIGRDTAAQVAALDQLVHG